MLRKKFRAYNLDQQYLVPPDIRDWVGEDHFARYISDFVSVLDLGKFEEAYKPGAGQPPYDPAMMLKIILYCSCQSVYSARRWEQATYNELGVRFLAANQHPDYSSFWKFKKRHGAAIEDLFIQIVCVAKEMGVVKLGDVALDGSLIKANASKSRNVLGSEIDELIETGKAIYEQMVELWADADADEKANNSDVPEQMRKAKNRIEALEKARAAANLRMANQHQKALDAFEAETPVEAPVTDDAREDGLDLRELREHRGYSQSELAKISGLPQPRISQLELGKRPPRDEEKEALEKALGPNVVIRFKRPCAIVTSKKPPQEKVQNFINYTDPDSAVISRCGKTTIQGFNPQVAVDVKSHIILGLLVSRDTSDRHNVEPMLEELKRTGCERFERLFADSAYYSQKNILALAELQIEAFIPPERKKKSVAKPCPVALAMREKMSSEEGKVARKLRATSVEPVFGHIKGPLNFVRFLSRGIASVTTEWSLVGSAHNLRKLLQKWK